MLIIVIPDAAPSSSGASLPNGERARQLELVNVYIQPCAGLQYCSYIQCNHYDTCIFETLGSCSTSVPRVSAQSVATGDRAGSGRTWQAMENLEESGHTLLLSVRDVLLHLGRFSFFRYPLCCIPTVSMSRLNANAFSFVPGQGFLPPRQPAQPEQPPLQPIERPAQTEAPPPPPTITLSIGGSKPAPKPSSRPPSPPPTLTIGSKPTPAPAPTAAKPTVPTASAKPSASPAPASTPAKSFTLERAKTDTAVIAQEVKNAADEETLKDLFGHSALCSPRTCV